MISPTDTLMPIAITGIVIWLCRLGPKRTPNVMKGSPVYDRNAAVNAGDVARAMRKGGRNG